LKEYESGSFYRARNAEVKASTELFRDA
jgi:hypothetical protein